MTHNTGNCKKYGKDGSLKKGFKKSGGQAEPKGNQNFVTILKEGFAEMTKILKDKKPSNRNERSKIAIPIDSLGGVVTGN